MSIRNSAGSASQYAFNLIPDAYSPRTKLRRPWTHKTTIGTQRIYPLFFDEVLPGDTFKLDVSCLCRMATLLTPFMDNLYLDWHFFFVPNRLVWDHWQAFMGEKNDPDDTTEYTIPYLVGSDAQPATRAHSVTDYLGVPVGIIPRAHDISALPLRGYRLIMDEWFRNENIVPKNGISRGDGPDILHQTDWLGFRAKRKDYFTSCLPWPQKGSPLIIPLGSSAPVVGTGNALGLIDGTSTDSKYLFSGSRTPEGNRGQLVTTVPSSAAPPVGDSYSVPTGFSSGDGRTMGVSTNPAQSGLRVDLTQVSAGTTVNELRQSFQLQRLFERDARGGTRYTEILRSHFNVVSPDARLQRPEFLGSFTVPINVHTITQTSASSEQGTAQGNLAGVGVASSVKRAFTKSFVEHGMVFGLASIRSEQSYWQGLPRYFSRSRRFDFYWPTLAHLGEQAVLNKEIYYQGTNADEDVFGYQERWSEYKYGRNIITNSMRPVSGGLGEWHLAQSFSSLPTLNETFIRDNPPVQRVLAVQDEPAFIVDCLFDLTCVRPLPLYDVPGYVDHF